MESKKSITNHIGCWIGCSNTVICFLKCHTGRQSVIKQLKVPLSRNVQAILVNSFAWQEEISRDYLFDIILIIHKAGSQGSCLCFWHFNFLMLVSLIMCSKSVFENLIVTYLVKIFPTTCGIIKFIIILCSCL